MRPFDTVVAVDWSARGTPSPARPSPDAIWIGVARAGDESTSYHRTRAAAMAHLGGLLAAEIAAGRRALVGFDFPLGWPGGFAGAVAGTRCALAVWDRLAEMVEDGDNNASNRWAVAARLNARFPGTGPFWGCPAREAREGLAATAAGWGGHGLSERRLAERRVPRAQPGWKLFGAGSVGSQALLGQARLARLRAQVPCAVWPFEAWDEAPIVLAEIYPSLIHRAVRAAQGEGIRDEVQVRLVARALMRLSREERLPALLDAPAEAAPEEGWILGLGHEAALEAAARPDLAPPRLADDCFALPPGVEWTSAGDALARLRAGLRPVTGVETVGVPEALGRVLARDAAARRASPPGANAAVDGYGFAHAATAPGDNLLPLVPGRAAAGAPLGRSVPEGSAARILTGALLPGGVDTVILQEDARAAEGHVAFAGPVKPRANTRRAGEDVEAGAVVLPEGRRLGAPDLALLSSVGIAEVCVRARLRVGVLSTGDEIAAPGETLDPARTFDANRPMLLALMRRWDHAAVDLGHAPDDRAALRRRLDEATGRCDAVLTSGGASAGEEDHMSALMAAEGRVETWRIAVKPGRPLMLGLWRGVPVFGLPGNPVAAFVCALIIARPALSVLSGGPWSEPQGFEVPAGFVKRKRAGRREFLRARIRAGRAEVFASEGSGRVSGLSWAEGLVDLAEEARAIEPGHPVRYLPYGSFGL